MVKRREDGGKRTGSISLFPVTISEHHKQGNLKMLELYSAHGFGAWEVQHPGSPFGEGFLAGGQSTGSVRHPTVRNEHTQETLKVAFITATSDCHEPTNSESS